MALLRVLFLLEIIASALACGEWFNTTSQQPFPKNPYDTPFPVNATNTPGSKVNSGFFCGAQGMAGAMRITSAGWLCITADQVHRSGTYLYPGQYAVLYSRYLKDPQLKLSTTANPIPKNAIPWHDGTYPTFICAALDATGVLQGGQLFNVPGGTGPQCLITTLQSLGMVTTPWSPGSYYVLVGTTC